MKKYLPLCIAFLLLTTSLCAQNNDSIFAENDTLAFQLAEAKKPVQEMWASTMLVDVQNSFIPPKGSVEVVIQHRFSNLENGIKDLFGIYGASNIRLAVSYSILNRLMVGFSTEKDHKYQEFFIKGNILEQNRKGNIPLSLTLFGNATINAGAKKDFGNNYHFTDRLSYFAQLILARKFSRIFSFEVAASYSHINKVDGVKITDTIDDPEITGGKIIRTRHMPLYKNGAIGVSAGGKINFYRRMSILFEYDQGFYLKKAENYQLKPKPNLALALEIATSTHCFQIFASSYRGIIPQHNYITNQFDFTKTKGIMLGFNITVRIN